MGDATANYDPNELPRHTVRIPAFQLGETEVTLGDDAPVVCGPGTIIRIPPKLDHRVVSTGESALKVLIVYSPPLPPRDDAPVE